jgi:hypothetical protein
MSAADSRRILELPKSLEAQLIEFRRRVWTIKSIEAACGAIFGIVIGYLAVYCLDRLLDTPLAARWTIFAVAMFGCAMLPVYFHRWIWRQRTLDQIARLVSRRYPSLGDQMLGVIELVRSDTEQHRSLALCQAAIGHVAAEASQRDFSDAVPRPRHRLWISLATAPAAIALVLALVYPSAAMNAWSRFVAPWRKVPRYTFATIENLPEKLVVAHGEAVTLPVQLKKDSRWQPQEATAHVHAGETPLSAPLKDGGYEFALPPQLSPTSVSLKVGDVRQRLRLEPTLRPELTNVMAKVQLPEYLERVKPLEKDIRGGTVSLVSGSMASFTATANRKLAQATIDDRSAEIKDTQLASEPQPIDASRKVVLAWQDENGLSGAAPFTITINAKADDAPSLAAEGLPRQKVVLDTETLTFQVRAQDDFGVKTVGVEWQSTGDSTLTTKKIRGEKLLAAGGSEQETLELTGTFCAQTMGLEPQPLAVRIFAVDYLPDRERVYSPTYLLYVLSAEQHAIWITEQMSKWHRQSLEVRDREMQLHHTNQQLRLLSAEELDRPEIRKQIENQSSAERANGRRLGGLAMTGEELLRQALRNPEIGVGHLEKWAEMLQILKDIAGNRMPNVADLLKQSAQAPGAVAASATKSGPMAGQIRSNAGGPGPATKTGEPTQPKPPAPQLVDRESSQQPAPKDTPPDGPPTNANSKQPRLGLPVTTVAASSPAKPSDAQTPAAARLDEAVKMQADLLAEFDRIAEELNQLLANLEGSTLVKRLKAASRKQYAIAGKIGQQLDGAFGRTAKNADGVQPVLKQLSTEEANSSLDLSKIMDDMEAYFERRRYQRFKIVLDEMRQEDAVGSLRQLGDDLTKEAGFSLAQCEFWSDTFDRWADNLLDPACSGKCPGCKSRASLPPSIVLEAMHILEAEINLREETRVAQQVRAGLTSGEFADVARALSKRQNVLSGRVSTLGMRIAELPEGKEEFAFEINLLAKVEQVMDEATEILDRPETGPAAIGAETEAIELLLQSKRINPRGRGGGGANPGGGGGGDTLDAALALFGAGLNEREVREERDVGHATGASGPSLPEEFRAGLDEYFNRMERSTR